MRPFDLVNKIRVLNPHANIDELYGPYESLQEAISAIPLELRILGRTVGIITGNSIEEYWWKEDLTDQGLIAKIPDMPDVDLSIKANIDGSNITDIISWQEALDIYSKSEVDNKFIDGRAETLTSINQPVLVGNILTIKYIGENGVEQQQNVDLSNLATIDIHITGASYNTSTNILSLVDNGGNVFQVNLSEFSIITSTNASGVTTLTQEGITKLVVSKAGQSGSYNDLLFKPYNSLGKNLNVVNGVLDVKIPAKSSEIVYANLSSITYMVQNSAGVLIPHTGGRLYKVTAKDTYSTYAVVTTGYSSQSNIIIDKDDNVYLPFTNGGFRVVKVSPVGSMTTINTDNYIMGMAVTSTGVIYIWDANTSNLKRLNTDGSSVVIGYMPSTVQYMTVDANDNIYAACYDNNSVWKSDGINPPTLLAYVGLNPRFLKFDKAGNLYVANSGSNSVSIITPAGGNSIFAYTGDFPMFLNFDSKGNLYVVNHMSNSITKVTPDKVVTTIPVASSPTSVYFDANDNMYVSFLYSPIKVYSEFGDNLAVDANGNIIRTFINFPPAPDISGKLDKPLAPNNVPTRVILGDGTTKSLSDITQDFLNNIKTLNFQLINGELIVQDGSEFQVQLVDNELIIN